MPAKKVESLKEMLRTAAKTGVALNGDIIIDLSRLSKGASGEKLTSKRSLRATTQAPVEKPSPFAHLAAAENMTPITSAGPLVSGIVIGERSLATFPSMAEHEKEICSCLKCPLGATRTKFVYGVGNTKAPVMFIGEAPGQKEDEMGEPFVGRSGQLLDKILAAIKFSRQDIYIANILKCRPPANRDPLPEEMGQCFPYLKEQIAIVRPKLLCALGRIASQALLATTTPIGQLRGKWHSYQGIPLIVTYHPAALLRNPNFKVGCWEDVQILRAAYDALTSASAMPAAKQISAKK